ncbi:ATP-binding cassette domain-containing protein [Propionibacterium freudenreichii]|uniref:ATP-binding cassette domain-containing protein n=1 Tax=Propionibacterium freudenreichii TaxID=1744 RepID=UPI0005A5C537|nr:excinuclease ABC subunit UvrA [Propionibacterium freudenreichii]CEI48958.1 UvrA, Excinuclease ATPase subunit [Propionibacterium freudenreichii]
MASAPHDMIRVQGARENNLKNITLDIPKRKLTVFTGVSGSGKSSLVFDTIASESRRLIDETYSAFLQGFMPTLGRPDADLLSGLTTAIVVDQAQLGANPRSTVGTVTDADAFLRVLFSRAGSPHIGSPKAFSFNVATMRGGGTMTVKKGTTGQAQAVKRSFNVVGGMCPRCEGRGTISEFKLAELYDEDLSLSQGAMLAPGYKAGGWNYRIYAESDMYSPDKPIKQFTKKELNDFLYHEPERRKIAGINMTYEGLVPRLQKSMLSKDPEQMQPHIRAFVDKAVTFATCPDCDGTRLSAEARSSKVDGLSIADANALQVTELADWLGGLELPGLGPLVTTLRAILTAFDDIGLGYLSLSRASGTLSGGESQRVKLIRNIGSPLTDITYVFDEPTAGLHPADVHRMNQMLLQLRDKGNTVLVVEHEPETIRIADHIVDLGPGAGSHGGELCCQGDLAGLRASDTLTGRHLDDRVAAKQAWRTPTGTLPIRHASLHNLRDVSVDIPLGVLCVVTGVAGSGKSSLVQESLPADAEAVYIDQTQVKSSRRSNPATYTGLLDPVRKAFAKANGVKPALFSSNSEGACPNCHGAGVVYTDLAMMGGVSSVCEVCEGKRFEPGVLLYKLAGLDISQVLALPFDEARDYFGAGPAKIAAAQKIVGRMIDVGLGYLSLGQPLTTLSGGERQRLKLAIQLGARGGIQVLDEPTAGLHPADVEQLLALLDKLVNQGHSLIVVEHDLAVMAHADWIIDMGPGAGNQGGHVTFEGHPADLAATGSGPTARNLAEYLGS